MRLLMKLVSLLFYGAYFLLIAPISIWMLFNAPTWIGKVLSIAGLVALPLPIFITYWYRQRKHQKIWGRLIIFTGIILTSILVIILLAAPSGNSNMDSPVQHRFSRETTFNRYALTNIIPESEQVNLGFLLMTYLDPILSAEQVDRVSGFTMDLYREMEKDSNFHELGSVMGLAYAEILGQPLDAGHYYLYVPQEEKDTPLPAIVFLHGSAGNFKSYLWVWSQLAEREGFVIISPSYGFGNWDEDGVTAVLQAIEDAKQAVDIDESRMYLAGLSNGGLGVTQLAAAYPEMFQGLVFVSPVMSTNIVDGKPFQSRWENRPILVISGETDNRVPVDYVNQRISRMNAGGIDVTSAIYSDEDHFLFYSQPEGVMQDVANWLTEN